MARRDLAAVPANEQGRARLELEFEEPYLLGPLFGDYDRHLITIENRLGVHIAARGNKVQIEGEADAAARARDVLIGLNTRLDHGQDVDAEAVEAVLAAAGHRVSRRRDGPFGLTAREVDVLRLLAAGLSNKEIAQRLVITPKTVGNHVEHIYAKIDIRSRAGVGLFAMQHGLLPEETFPAVAPVA